MVYNGKPYQNGWFGGTTIFGNIHISISMQCRRYRHFFLFEVSFDDLFVSKHPVWLFQWGFMQRHGYKLCGNFSVTWMKLKSIWKRTDNHRFAASSIGLQVLHPLLVRLHEWSCWWQRFQAAAKGLYRYPSILSHPSQPQRLDKVCRSLIYKSHWHIQIWKVFNPTKILVAPGLWMPGMLARWLPVWPPYFISWTPVLKQSIGAGNPKVTSSVGPIFHRRFSIYSWYLLRILLVILYISWTYSHTLQFGLAESSTESAVFIQKKKSDPKKSLKQRQ